jgi:hypothetical protein
MKPNNQIWNQLSIWIMVKGGYFWWKNEGGKSRATIPLTTKYSKSFQRSFVIGSIIVFSFEGIRNSVYTNLCGIPRYWTVKNFAELHEIKSIPYKIPYSAEFQKSTSENTLIPRRGGTQGAGGGCLSSPSAEPKFLVVSWWKKPEVTSHQFWILQVLQLVLTRTN